MLRQAVAVTSVSHRTLHLFRNSYASPSDSTRVCCDLSGGGRWSAWHIPPSWDENIAVGYENSGCDTFYVARNPVERMISQWKFEGMKSKDTNCSIERFEHHVRKVSAAYAAHRETKDCHYAPQVDYVFLFEPREERLQTRTRFQ